MARNGAAPHGVKKNQVAKGKGAPLASDGSGRNKSAALNDKGIAKGQSVKKGMVKHDGHSSPIGKQRPTQDGGPRTGQKSGVDTNVHGRTTHKDWGWSV